MAITRCAGKLGRSGFVAILGLIAAPAPGQDFDIYVSDAGNFANPPWQILRFDQDGQNPQVFTEEALAWPQDIVFLEPQGTVLISNLNSGIITRHAADDGEYLDDFATGIAGPTRMKIGDDGLLYVLQWSGNGRVRRYELDGTYLGEFTTVGVAQSIGLDWDAAGNLYVSSYSGGTVRKFDASGADQGAFIDANLAGPTNIWFDASGDLLVLDYDGTAVKRFSAAGAYEGEFIQGLSQAEGIATLPNGNLLIGNGGSRSVKMFGSNGEYLEDLIASGAGGLLTPNAVVVRTAGAGFSINAGLNDAWFNPATGGQGFFITVFPDIQQLFLAWFTYDTVRPPQNVAAMLGEPGHRWLTAFGPYSGNEAILDIEVTSGGVFDAAEPAPGQQLDGTITLRFTGCNAGSVSYAIPSVGREGTIAIERIALDNLAFCESLASQAPEP